MTHWPGSIVAILLTSFPPRAAQVLRGDISRTPRTDCIGLSKATFVPFANSLILWTAGPCRQSTATSGGRIDDEMSWSAIEITSS